MLFVLLLAAGVSPAQSTYGNFVGNVQDSSGAVVPGAIVKATNESRGTSTTTTASATGEYRLVNLDAGTYTLTVTSPNFDTLKDEHVVLPARETIRADLKLSVKSVAEEVVVTSNEEVISQDLTVSNSLSGNEINSLALNFRATTNPSPIDVALLTPTVNIDSSGANGNLTFAGQLPTATSFSIDGISIQQVRAGGPLTNLFPSVEDIDEFRVNTAGASAEFAQPSDLTVTTKGGTNAFHGAIYWFLQRKGFDAIDPIANVATGANGNDYGVSVSGPIWKNHTFFWFDYETDRLGQNTLLQSQTFPTAWTTGNFTGVTGLTLYNPATGQPFPTNNLSLIAPENPTSVKITPLFFPTPTSASQNPDATGNNYNAVFPGQFTTNSFDGRIDHIFNPKNRIFGRVTQKQITSTGADAPVDPTYNPLMGSFTSGQTLLNLAFAYNRVLSPTLVNELRGGFTYGQYTASYPQAAQGNADIANFGITGTPGPPANGLNGVPVFYIGNLLSGQTAGTDNDGHPSITNNNIFEVGDNLTWVHGKFNTKFGFDFRRLGYTANITFIDGDEYGDYHSTGVFVCSPAEIATYPDACGAAQYYFGYLDYATQAQNGPDGKPYDHHYDGFGQTDYKLNDRLTMTFGFRYEVNTPFIDQTNQLGNFDTNYPGGALIVNPGEKINKIWAAAVGNTPFITNTNNSILPPGLRFTDKTNWQPRFGVSYRPFKNDDGVIKASIGEYSVPVLGAVLYSLLGVDTSYYGVYASTPTNPLNWQNVFSGTVGQGSAYPGYRRANQFDLKDPRIIQWNVQLEQNVGHNILVRLNYIGSHTYDLIESPDLNQVPPNTTGLASGTSALNAETPQQRASILRFPNFNEVLTRQNGPEDKYNALVIEVNRRFTQGLSFTNAYTYTSNRTNALGAVPTSATPVGSSGAGDNGGNVLNYYNIKQDIGPAFYDPQHKILSTVVYNLPVGHGKQFLGNAGRMEDALLGGYTVNGIFLFHTGNFLTPYFPDSAGDPSGTNPAERSVANQRPDCASKTSGYISNPTTAKYFSASGYTVPKSDIGRFGNCSVGALQGPKTTTFSMSVGKSIPIKDRVSLRYEAQFSNLFNITNWANPNMNITSAQFGQITSARAINNGEQSGPRSIQMTLRINY